MLHDIFLSQDVGLEIDKCGICTKPITKKGHVYICYDCLKYGEHEECGKEQWRGDTSTLNIDTLNHVLKYDEISQEYGLTISNGAMCPTQMSVTTPGFINLTGLFDKPLVDTYFEVTFLAFKSEGTVGIFIDTEHNARPTLLGPDATAYINDGRVRYNFQSIVSH